MNWIKTNYERAILIFFAIALLACSGLVGWMAFSFPESFSGRKNLKAPDNKISALDFTSVAEAAALADAPRTWSLHEGSLFVSRIYVLKGGKPPLINPTESDVPIHPPISNAWIQKYGLDFSDSKLKDQDPDGDGFTNLEEFLGGADPTDPKSHPPFYTKLRLKNFISKPFFLKFSGDSGDNTYTINTKLAI